MDPPTLSEVVRGVTDCCLASHPASQRRASLSAPPRSGRVGGSMSFRSTEPLPKTNLCVRNKTYKAPTTTTMPLRIPGAEAQHFPSQVSLRAQSPSKEDRVSCHASCHMHNSSISVDGGHRVSLVVSCSGPSRIHVWRVLG